MILTFSAACASLQQVIQTSQMAAVEEKVQKIPVAEEIWAVPA